MATSVAAWLAGDSLPGLVASALGFIVYGSALRMLDASLVGVFVNLDPNVGVLTGVVFLGESVRVWHLGGGAVAIVGMWLASSQSAAIDDGAR